jgi:hypothetical protein
VKIFFGGLFVSLALVAVGWNYWATHRAGVSPGDRNPSPGLARGADGRRSSARPATSVTGTVRMAGGVAHSAHVELVRVAPEGAPRLYASAEALGDGRFSFAQVTADRYWAVARTEVDADPMRPGEGPFQAFYGLAEVVSDGERPAHVAIQLYPATMMSGRVVVDAKSTGGRAFDLLTVSLRPVDAQARAATATGEASAGLATDGRFTITEVPPGRYKLDVSPSPWTVDAMVVADQDRLDRPFQIGTGERLTALITLTERPNQVGGTLRDASGRALAFSLVTIFSVDGAQREAHRRVQLVRTDATGAFRFDGLPSGEYVLAPADGFDPEMWRTVPFFERLTPSGQRVAVGHGRPAVRDLKLVGR